MTTSFNVLSSALPRLTNLRCACDSITRGALAHVHLSVTADDARFVASDGHLLAILKLPVTEFDGDPINLVIDGPLFAAACTTVLRADHATTLRIIIESGEVRFIRGTAIAIATVLDLAYPLTTAFLDRYRGLTMVPAIATFAPAVITAASRIAGARKTTLMLWSPTSDPALTTCWASGEGDYIDQMSRESIRRLLCQPGIWADRELLILIMPVTRSLVGAPNVDAFVGMSLLSESTVSAA